MAGEHEREHDGDLSHIQRRLPPARAADIVQAGGEDPDEQHRPAAADAALAAGQQRQAHGQGQQHARHDQETLTADAGANDAAGRGGPPWRGGQGGSVASRGLAGGAGRVQGLFAGLVEQRGQGDGLDLPPRLKHAVNPDQRSVELAQAGPLGGRIDEIEADARGAQPELDRTKIIDLVPAIAAGAPEHGLADARGGDLQPRRRDGHPQAHAAYQQAENQGHRLA